MKNKEIISEWLKRAKSNLEIARAGKSSKEILYEDLCFDAQHVIDLIKYEGIFLSYLKYIFIRRK